MTTIYVYLLDEGTDVWRPVPATKVLDDVFVIDPQATIPDGEVWQFQPGHRVRCRWKQFSNGEAFVAVESARLNHA